MRMIRTLMLGFLAVGLLVGAAQAQDRTGLWLVAALDSASDDVSVQSNVCVVAFQELIVDGFDFLTRSGTGFGKDYVQETFTFTSDNDTVFLTCVAQLNPRDLFGPGGPSGPGGPF